MLVTKPEHLQEANRLLFATGILIRVDGSRYLGGVVGTEAFRKVYLETMMKRWCADMRALA